MSRRTGTFRILIGDTLFGPMSYDEGLSLVAAGRLSDSDRVSKDDGLWNPASEFFDLKPNATSTRQPPPPPEDSPSTQQDRWQYHKDGKTHGPFTTDEMLRFLEQGRIVAETLTWKPGLAAWLSLRDTDIWQPININEKHQLTLSCLWIYRSLLLVAVVAVFCPWIGASTSSAFGSYSTSIAGISLGWGILVLVAAVCGLVGSFFDKNSIPAELRWLPVGIGIAVAMFPLIASFSMNTVAMSGNFDGLSSQTSAGAQFGLWLTLLSGAATAVAAYLSFIKGVPDIVIGNSAGSTRSATFPATPEAGSSPSKSMARWYYSKDGLETGPMPANFLKTLVVGGKLSPSDLVRSETSSEWQSAGRVKGLFAADVAVNTPPPLPPEATVIQLGMLTYLLNHWRETRGTILAPLLLGISPVLILSILKPLLTWENEVAFAILILILSGILFWLYLFSQIFEYIRGIRSVTPESWSRLSFWSHQLACFVVLMLLPFLTVEYFMNQRGIVVTMIPGIRVLQDDLFGDRQLPSLLDSLREWQSSMTSNESLVEIEQPDAASANHAAPDRFFDSSSGDAAAAKQHHLSDLPSFLVTGRGSNVTKSKYEQIKNGMSLAEVEGILGAGEEQASSSIDIPGQSISIPGAGSVSVSGISTSGQLLQWHDGTKIITIMMLDGKVMSKAQFGL